MAQRPTEVAHDEAPSDIVDHPFKPKGEWWSLCGNVNSEGELCNLAESAHRDTTNHGNGQEHFTFS